MSSLNEISRAIGALQERTDHLIKQTEHHATETAVIKGELHTIKADMAIVKKDVSDFKPAAKKIAKWEQRAIGVSVVSGFVGSWILAHIRGWLG